MSLIIDFPSNRVMMENLRVEDVIGELPDDLEYVAIVGINGNGDIIIGSNLENEDAIWLLNMGREAYEE